MSVETQGPERPNVKLTRPTMKGNVLPVLAAALVSEMPCSERYRSIPRNLFFPSMAVMSGNRSSGSCCCRFVHVGVCSVYCNMLCCRLLG